MNKVARDRASAIALAASVKACDSDLRVEIRTEVHPPKFADEKADFGRTETVYRTAEYRAPKVQRDMSDVFRFLERSFFKQPHKGQAPRPAPAEQLFQRHAAETIETHPYALVSGGKVCGLFQRGDDVVKRAQRMGPKAEVWHIGWKHRYVEGADCQVVRSDRARGPSAHLSGSSLRTVKQFVPTTLSRQVVWTARDGFTAAA